MQNTLDQHPPEPGKVVELASGVSRVLAPNPSPMTFWGTNTYLLGHDRLTIIDPGPISPQHLKALITAIAGRPVDQIIVSHSHLDHSPLARQLASHTGAPVLAFGNSAAGRSDVMHHLASGGELAGGEGVDRDFRPDDMLGDGAVVSWSEGPVTAFHTPGHMGNHICLQWQDVLFTGDHIMGWATSLVSPPDGDLTDFMASCHKLLTLPDMAFFPGHGPLIQHGHKRIRAILEHRLGRETAILSHLQTPATAAQITAEVYADIPVALLPAAERNVFAHLIDLSGRRLVRPQGALAAASVFERMEPPRSPW